MSEKLNFAPAEKRCIWMDAGVVSFKLCNNNFNCLTCNFDKGMYKKAQDEGSGKVAVKPDKAPTESWVQKFLALPASQRKCRYMLNGAVPFKICPNAFQCGECTFDQMMQDRIPATSVPRLVDPPLVAGFTQPEGYYYHRGHTWAVTEFGGRVRVGLDDFAQRLVGDLDEIQLPKLGQKVSPGAPGMALKRKKQEVPVLAPIDGVITHINNAVTAHPDLINKGPYEEGWLFIVEPAALKNDLKGMLFGPEAKQWLSEEKDRLVQQIQTDIGPTALDGGLPGHDFTGTLRKKKWAAFVKRFLLT
ncbi:MAG: glycine cleavage system protein H [Deltaproteobacteria bacterium]|nr:glycine cleavage system protein H [Deltaproteobacteria bacterium]